MALPRSFANQANPVMSWLDQNFAAIGESLYIGCTVAGSANAIVLTPTTGRPAVEGYTQLQGYSFFATSNNTGATTLQLSGLGVLSVFKSTASGAAALVAGDVRAGNYYVAVYNSALNSGAGGFLLFGIAGLPTQNVSPNTFLGGPTSAVAGPPTFRQLVAADLPSPLAAGNLFIGTSGSGFAQNQLTAGLNIDISNGDGTVTISARGSAAGNVIGPATSTAGALAAYSDTTGQVLINTGVIGANTPQLNAVQTWTSAQGTTTTTLSGISVVIDYSRSNAFSLSATSGTAFQTAINAGLGGVKSSILVYTQGSSGNCQISFPGTNFVFAGGTSATPTATLTANAVDWFGLCSLNSSNILVTTIGLDVKRT